MPSRLCGAEPTTIHGLYYRTLDQLYAVLLMLPRADARRSTMATQPVAEVDCISWHKITTAKQSRPAFQSRAVVFFKENRRPPVTNALDPHSESYDLECKAGIHWPRRLRSVF